MFSFDQLIVIDWRRIFHTDKHSGEELWDSENRYVTNLCLHVLRSYAKLKEKKKEKYQTMKESRKILRFNYEFVVNMK